VEVVFVGLVVVARVSLVVAIICLTVLAVRKNGLQGRRPQLRAIGVSAAGVGLIAVLLAALIAP
jgi:multisubunit Na+/H+ antiporter MnhB subunit